MLHPRCQSGSLLRNGTSHCKPRNLFRAHLFPPNQLKLIRAVYKFRLGELMQASASFQGRGTGPIRILSWAAVMYPGTEAPRRITRWRGSKGIFLGSVLKRRVCIFWLEIEVRVDDELLRRFTDFSFFF